ncbi:MAG: intradiol ring-cleavage dioxygenase [Thermoleophilia bacterium]|nr:intradiol ring-cleavage dioxygenase [Thermoleophilia bacterium]
MGLSGTGPTFGPDPDEEPTLTRHLTRRQLVGLTGAAGAALLLGRGRLPGLPGAVPAADAAVACVLTPEKTEGPYFVDERLLRGDIRTDPSDGSVSGGVPLRLRLVVLATDAGCAPVVGALVDVWHADAAGRYSDEAANGTVGRRFLRGYQVTDADGAVEFTTVYPGWYRGRTVHIHFKVRTLDGSTVTSAFTSQIFFEEAVTDAVMARSPYATRGTPDTRNADDGIHGSDGSSLTIDLDADGAGYSGTFTVGVTGVPASHVGGAGGGSGTGTSLGTITSVAAARTAPGARVVRVGVRLGATTVVDASVRRAGRVLGHRRRVVAAGDRVIGVPVRASAAAGAANAVVRFERSGRTQTLRRGVRIPRRVAS